jgi:hypothetical protein
VRRLNKREKLLFVLPCVLPLVCLAWPLVANLRVGTLEGTIQSLSEPGAMDCGTSKVTSVAQRRATASCMGRTFGARKPFRGQYGSDSPRSYGIVGTTDGKVYCVRLQQSSLPHLPHRVEALLCKEPKLQTEPNGFQHLTYSGMVPLSENR